MPRREFDLAVFLRTYAQLNYTYDSRKDGPWMRYRIRFIGSTEILKALNGYLHLELAVSWKTIQNHKVSKKMKVLYIQSKREVPAVLE